jgi:hypothetical protein
MYTTPTPSTPTPKNLYHNKRLHVTDEISVCTNRLDNIRLQLHRYVIDIRLHRIKCIVLIT